MRQFLAALVLLLAFPAQAQDAAIRGVISDQLEAFQADDYEEAFDYAAPGIQSLFGTPERFGAMVRQGYPMVHRPGEVRYLDLREMSGTLRQRVMIRDQAGEVHLLDYDLAQIDGAWRISAVRFVEDDSVGV